MLKKHILLDGQQRITTLLILLCVIRDITKDDLIKNKINRILKIDNNDNNKKLIIKLK